MSRDLRVRLIPFKIEHRIYRTPSRLYRLGLKDWKCGGAEATLVHVLSVRPRNLKKQAWKGLEEIRS